MNKRTVLAEQLKCGRNDVFVAFAAAAVEKQWTFFVETKKWSPNSIEIVFTSLKAPTELPPVVCVAVGSRWHGYVPRSACQQQGVWSRDRGAGAGDQYTYRLKQREFSRSPSACAFAAAADSDEPAGVLLDDDDVVMTPVKPLSAAVKVKAEPPPQQPLSAVATKQQPLGVVWQPKPQPQPLPIHESFDVYQTPPDVKRDVTQQELAALLRSRIELLQLAIRKDALERVEGHRLRDVLLLGTFASVNLDRASMHLARLAFGRAAVATELRAAWHRAEKELLRLRLIIGYRMSIDRREFTRRFVRRALPFSEYKQPSREDKGGIDGDWLAVPFESALHLVGRRDCVLSQGLAMFPCGPESLVKIVKQYFTADILWGPLPAAAASDPRLKVLLGEFRSQLHAILEVKVPAPLGAVRSLDLLGEATSGAPPCIQGIIKMLKTGAGYLKHFQRVSFGTYIRARGISVQTPGTETLLKGGMFRGDGQWKSVREDIFPSKAKSPAYCKDCRHFQEASPPLCPFMAAVTADTEKKKKGTCVLCKQPAADNDLCHSCSMGKRTIAARKACAASVGILGSAMRSPFEYTEAYARNKST